MRTYTCTYTHAPTSILPACRPKIRRMKDDALESDLRCQYLNFFTSKASKMTSGWQELEAPNSLSVKTLVTTTNQFTTTLNSAEEEEEEEEEEEAAEAEPLTSLTRGLYTQSASMHTTLPLRGRTLVTAAGGAAAGTEVQRAHLVEEVTEDTYTAGQRALLQLLQIQRAQPLVAASSCSDSIESLFSHPPLSPLRESLSSSLVLLSLLQREETRLRQAARTHLRMQHVCRW